MAFPVARSSTCSRSTTRALPWPRPGKWRSVAVWRKVPPRSTNFTGRELQHRLEEQLATGPEVVVLQFRGHGVQGTPLVVGVVPGSCPAPVLGTAWESLALLDTCSRSTDFLRGQLERARERVVVAGPAGADEWLEMIRTPRSELWLEAAAAVLLDEQWTRPGPDDDPVAYFKKRLRRAVGQWRWSWERRLNRRFVGC